MLWLAAEKKSYHLNCYDRPWHTTCRLYMHVCTQHNAGVHTLAAWLILPWTMPSPLQLPVPSDTPPLQLPVPSDTPPLDTQVPDTSQHSLSTAHTFKQCTTSITLPSCTLYMFMWMNNMSCTKRVAVLCIYWEYIYCNTRYTTDHTLTCTCTIACTADAQYSVVHV